ncbi:MAG: class I SAM-dependent methyltransferase [Sulfuricaulis sp.]|uniref:class I SAM-dependent methyltransferase n=1 Tax=Sulfuricaulis sp. TaxID=2003553 RepID=UPI0025DBC48A|nr:class I SAM-dependent methyltransferase [Sulfuricaulis sp.]MCR4347055.1 class I SAM-dependent methyltransferase [Sulfuricaulis sp.]
MTIYMEFKDHFSQHASDYARHRPDYPAALYEFLAEKVKQREVAWDCGTGSGQAALGLAEHFDRVIATDPSAEQIRNAARHEKISYAVVPAEQTEIPSHTVGLITVAQAVHWFDMERFYREARRVLRPDGMLAVWCYGLSRINPEIDKVVQHYYTNIVGPYWPRERHYIDEKYETLSFPFAELPVPEFNMKAEWDMHEFMGYLHTWSATQQFQEENEQDPLNIVHRLLAKAWGDPETRHAIRWPLYLRLGKVSAL